MKLLRAQKVMGHGRGPLTPNITAQPFTTHSHTKNKRITEKSLNNTHGSLSLKTQEKNVNVGQLWQPMFSLLLDGQSWF